MILIHSTSLEYSFVPRRESLLLKGGGIREADDGGLCFGRAKTCEANEILQDLFTSYVRLRRTQSSVSLRLTAPFKRSLFALFPARRISAPGRR